MPLESPSFFDNAAHRELDNKVMEDLKSAGVEVLSTGESILLLDTIIRYSNNQLDTNYLALTEAKHLIKTNDEFRNMLATAWERKSYCEIRNLGVYL